MIENISADEVFAEILLLRTVSNNTLLLVEGNSDRNTLEPHIDLEQCELIVAYSKSAVVGAVILADQRGVVGVLGLVDRDWIGFGHADIRSPNVLFTDRYDLEATLFLRTDLVDRFFAAHTDRGARETFLADRGVSTVRDLLAKMVAPTGVLRWLSDDRKWELSMSEFPAHVALDAALGDTDLRKLVQVALGRSKHPPEIKAEALVQLLREASTTVGDTELYCSGKDMACCLMHVLASRFSRRMSIGVLLGNIRAMLSHDDLKLMDFYNAVSVWSASHDRTVWSAA